MSALEEVRERTTRTLVEALREHRTLSRAELGLATGLSRTTVTSIVEDLGARGLILEQADTGSARRTRGRPPTLVRLHPTAGVALGISIDQETLEVALVDLALTVLAHRSAGFEAGTPVESLIDLATELADQTLAEPSVPRGQLIGATVGLPGPIDPRSGEVHQRILGRWSRHDVGGALSAHLGVPVTIENDANLEGLAEAALGAGVGFGTIVYVKTSWGIGGAVIRGGRVYRGRHGHAGEFAHIQVREDGPVCGCGRRGCLGQLASGHVVRELLAPARGRRPTLREIVGLAGAGDIGATRALTDSGLAIGEAIAGTCLALNPDAVVAGGELGAPGSPLVDGVRHGLERRALPAAVRAISVLPATLGANAGALGGASLVVRSSGAAAHLAGQLRNRLKH
jgi:predicted NBD/HSP70 family sugar kinase